MSAKVIAEAILLGASVLSCWLGVAGLLRMRDPFQALHYASLPASVAGIGVTVAVWLSTGWGQTAWKTTLIAFILFGINSVGTHASARAFRARQLGHWEPRDGDPIEFSRDFKDGEQA